MVAISVPGRPAFWGTACAAGFALLLVVTRLGLLVRVDERLTDLAQARPSQLADRLAIADTLLGDPIVTLAIAVALGAWLLRTRSFAFLAPLLILVTSAVELVCKLSIVHAPPPSTYARVAQHLLSIGTDPNLVSSFPSGHVARVTFLAVLVSAMVPSTVVRLGAAALVAVTMVSRVYLGAHWPSDTVGGLLLGIVVAVPAVLWIRSSGGTFGAGMLARS